VTGALFVERRGPTIVVDRIDSATPSTTLDTGVAAVAIAKMGQQGRPGIDGLQGPAGPPGESATNEDPGDLILIFDNKLI